MSKTIEYKVIDATTLNNMSDGQLIVFCPKPVLLYDKIEKMKVAGIIAAGHDSANGIYTLDVVTKHVTDTLWTITGMDLSQFTSIKVVYVRDDENHATTAEFRIPLDYPVLSECFTNTGAHPTFGNRDRWNCCLCAISADKTKFCLCQTYSLFGSSPTTLTELLGLIYIVRIYGCYD